MAPDPKCAALASAKDKAGLTYHALAEKVNQPEQHVIDICTGKVTPTASEFQALTTALGITANPPSDSAHATK